MTGPDSVAILVDSRWWHVVIETAPVIPTRKIAVEFQSGPRKEEIARVRFKTAERDGHFGC